MLDSHSDSFAQSGFCSTGEAADLVSSTKRSTSVFDQKVAADCARILVVDDSASQRLMLKAILEQRSFQVDTARSAHEALEQLRDKSYHVIISDWIMPGLTGLDFCRIVKGCPDAGKTYFILSSSKNEKRDIAEGLDAGADDFVTKPVNDCELMARIRVGCRTVKLQDEIAERNRGLIEANGKLQSAYDTINSDLRIAARMQSTLVPEKHSYLSGAEIGTAYLPCAHLGGDLIGYFGPPTNYVSAYSIDVSGHGIPAALLSTVLSQALSGFHWSSNMGFRASVRDEPELLDPAHTAAGLNSRFLDWGQSNQYFTMALAKIDPKSGHGLLCQAGHPAPAIIRSGGAIEFVGNGGMPIGMLPMATFDSVPFRLDKNDILVMYSDGVTEAELANGQLLGEEGLTSILEQMRYCPLNRFGDELISRISSVTGRNDFSDDVSVLALRI